MVKRRKVSKFDKFYYVFLLKMFKCFLELENVVSEVLNPHAQASNDNLGDFCDGSAIKSHPLFNSDPLALQIIACYDEVEIVNSIGSYGKKQKLGCIFFFIGNLRPQFLSTFKSIYLVAVAKSVDISRYSIDAFLNPFIEDLSILYCNGMDVIVGG